jgi:hypothetical protein
MAPHRRDLGQFRALAQWGTLGYVGDSNAMRLAYRLSAMAIVLMAVTAAIGCMVPGFYPDIPWAAEALRGGDLVTLVVAVPILTVAVLRARAGSWRAPWVWAGMLGYAVYNYAYVVFGAAFNDLFLAHVAILSLSLWALICLLTGIASERLEGPSVPPVARRCVAAFFAVVAGVLVGLWTYSSLRQAITGHLPAGAAPPAALHMVYATDLTFFAIPLGVVAVLLWRGSPWGLRLGPIMAVTGGSYLLNLLAAAAFQAHADVPGVAAFSPGSALLDLCFIAAAVILLRHPSAAGAVDSGAEFAPADRA